MCAGTRESMCVHTCIHTYGGPFSKSINKFISQANVYLTYYWRKRTLKCVTVHLIGREKEARALIGLEGFRGSNQNTECIHDSQWEGCSFLSANQNTECIHDSQWEGCIFLSANQKDSPKGGAGTPLVCTYESNICVCIRVVFISDTKSCEQVTPVTDSNHHRHHPLITFTPTWDTSSPSYIHNHPHRHTYTTTLTVIHTQPSSPIHIQLHHLHPHAYTTTLTLHTPIPTI